MHVEGNTVQGDDAAEHDADVANREQGIAPLRKLDLRHVVSPSSMIARIAPCNASRWQRHLRLSDPLGHTRNSSS